MSVVEVEGSGAAGASAYGFGDPGRAAAVRALLAGVGGALSPAGAPQLVSSHHADTYRWGGAAVRVMWDGSGGALHRVWRHVSSLGVGVPELLAFREEGRFSALATRWHDTASGTEDHVALGSVLRRLHTSRPCAHLPPARAGIAVRWSSLDASPRPIPPAMLAVVAEAERTLLAAERACGRPVMLHGDLNGGNVIWTKDGPLLIDWELASSGPSWWDLAHVRVHRERYDADPGAVDQVMAGYGEDPRGHPEFEALCLLRCALSAASALRRAQLAPAGPWPLEAEVRLSFWEGDVRRWRDLPLP